MNAVVACKRIETAGKDAVLTAVSEAMQLAEVGKAIRGRRLFIKVNLMSTQVVPGTCTSPWVLAASLKMLRERFAGLEVHFGDADAYGVERAEEAARNWGLLDVAKSFDAKFVNLSKAPTVRHRLGETLGEVELPALLLDTDSLITLPVIKTHYLTIFTGALKNQWGLLPNVRYKYHPVFPRAICEINGLFRGRTVVVSDMTVCQQGLGPRMGNPVAMNMVLSSTDPVAADSAASSFIGIPSSGLSYLQLAQQERLGTTTFDVVGDEPNRRQFESADVRHLPLLRLREHLKEIPVINRIFLNGLVYALQAKLGRVYVKRWFKTKGEKLLKEYANSGFYTDEFSELLNRGIASTRPRS